MGYPITYLYLACFVAMVVAGTAIWLTVPPQPARKWLLLTPVCVAGWTLSDFLSNLATKGETCRFIGELFVPLWAPVPFLVLWVAIHYALPEESGWRSRRVGALLFLPTLVCLALVYTGLLHTSISPAHENGRYFVPNATPWHLIPIAYFLVYVGASAGILHRAARRIGDPMVEAMSHFFMRGMIPAALLGALANGGLSLMGIDSPHVGSVMATVLLAVVAVGVWKRGFFKPLHEVVRDRDAALISLSRREELLTATPFGVAIVDLQSERLVFRNAPFSSLVEQGQETTLLEGLHAHLMPGAPGNEEVRRTEIVLDASAIPPRVLEVLAVRFSYGGEEACLLGVRDVSRERSLEARLHQAEQLQALGTLAGGIAHDMNNILAVIMLLADGLEADVPGLEQKQRTARRIVDACRRGRDLTGNILAFTHQRTPQWSAVSVPGLVQSTLEQVRPSLPVGVAVEVEIAPTLPDVLGDEAQLGQALVNLCRNAAEAMPKGGRIRITADLVPSAKEQAGAPSDTSRTAIVPEAATEPATELAAERAAHAESSEALGGDGGTSQASQAMLRLRVEDNGEGMDERTRRRCLEPLYTTKPIGRGTGLGLAVVHNTVIRHGGSLQVESDPGQGTRMTLLFPLHAPAEDAPVAAHAVERPPSAPSWRVPQEEPPPTVLLVEDEDELRTITRSELEALGCRVLEAADGREALAHYEDSEDDIDLVLLDLVMPDLDGAETFRLLRDCQPELPIVLMSGYGHEADVEKLIADGANGFLAKPFDRKGLASSVRRGLARRVAAGKDAVGADEAARVS